MGTAVRRNMSDDMTFKFILVGDTGVGKSAIFTRYTDGAFSSQPQRSIGVVFGCRTIWLDDKSIKLMLWDTARPSYSYYRGAAGALVVYDGTSPSSFEHVREWMAEIEQVPVEA